ncbi:MULTISPECIES: HPr family phosphocarrier protein [Caproicibacterium]|uniref:HPr family phosphocarrier protein n=1 Tax=Caproicibacterium argilliputei TaxID=3030016 RepID=A0AA97DC46_9FIRM|nr:HPr family phosphocarrier protein [Caproicibacterium argilliputei]WOC32845.1 HPr family phosphocarrier protein [Caproicibacterium argilliputei]
MLQKTWTIPCKQGFHLRPAQLLTETAGQFQAAVTLHKAEEPATTAVDAKSILGLMGLGLAYGQSVTVITDGSDEAAAMQAVQKLFDTRFGEE